MNHKSISKRLTLRFTLLILSFSVVLLLVNSLLLKPLYYRSVKNDMIDGISQLMALDYNIEDGQWMDQVTIDPGHSYDVTIVIDGAVMYSSSMDVGIRNPHNIYLDDGNIPPNLQKPEPDRPDSIFFFPESTIRDWEVFDENISIGELFNERENLNLFVAKTETDQGVEIYLTQGVEPVLNSVRQANILLLMVSAVFLVIGVIVAFFLSRNFSKPIRIMQTHVMKLSKLEFEEQLDIRTNDELEALSIDINTLSGELQSALATLKKQNQQLEKDVISQRKFISNASHELRTPLALIKGYADEIAQGHVKNRDQEHIYVGYIAEESTKMKRLLNEILELSRLESGYKELQYMTHDIPQVIQSFLDKYSGFIETHQLNIQLDLMAGKGYFDDVKFEQILANYISNAGKYCDAKKYVQIISEDMGEVFRITVKNSGEAISEDVMAYIWDGFYKADEARTETEGSYGLGLSIVKAIQDLAGQGFGCYNEAGYVAFWFEIAKAVQ